ncbi:MAG: hypothetical protein JSV10_09245, partial [Candidatus Zixiibacteriota bacterium]
TRSGETQRRRITLRNKNPGENKLQKSRTCLVFLTTLPRSSDHLSPAHLSQMFGHAKKEILPNPLNFPLTHSDRLCPV